MTQEQVVTFITCTKHDFEKIEPLLSVIKDHAQTATKRAVFLLDTSSWLTPQTGITESWNLLNNALVAMYAAAMMPFWKNNRLDAQIDIVFLSWHPNMTAEQWISKFMPTQTNPVSLNIAKLATNQSQTSDLTIGKSYSVTALGGTFDHLHSGHKVLLTMGALLTTNRLVVGVTGDALLKNKKYADQLQSGDVRAASVRDFLRLINSSLTYDIVTIEDVYGPTATDGSIQALTVSEETASGGKSINEERHRRGLNPLEIYTIGLVQEDSAADKLSSTELRKWYANNINAKF